MDLGKLNLPIAAQYNGDLVDTLIDLHAAFFLLQKELAVTTGTASLVAEVNIAKGQAVSLNNGLLRLADASLSRPAIGIAMQSVSAGARCKFMLAAGYVAGLTGLTANGIAYLGNAGAITFTRPVSGVVQSLGIAISTTELFVCISSDLTPASSGGGATALTVTITVPAAGQREHTETVAAVGCTPTSKLLVCLAPALDSEENDPITLDVVSLSAVSGTDQATISIAFSEETSGPIKLNLLVA